MRLKKRIKSIGTKKNNRNILIIGSSIFFIILVIFVLRIVSFLQTITISNSTTKNVTQNVKEKTEYNFLLLGYGGGKHEGTYLTDTIMVAHVNIPQKKAVLISFPRDMWVKVPTLDGEKFYSKINALYQFGISSQNYKNIDRSSITTENPSGILKNAIKEVSGLEIDAFLAIDFDGFKNIIDTIGGIDINVEKTFTDYEYPIEENMNDLCGKDEEFAKIEPIINKKLTKEEIDIFFMENPDSKIFYEDITKRPVITFPCRYETLTFTKGITTMDGETALKFARSRHALSDGGDFNRARRQQQVIDAVLKKVISIDFLPKALPLLSTLEDNVRTDFPLTDINKFLRLGNTISEFEINTLVISDKYLKDDYSSYGGYILVSKDGNDNWNMLKSDIKNIILGITPTQVAISPTPISRR